MLVEFDCLRSDAEEHVITALDHMDNIRRVKSKENALLGETGRSRFTGLQITIQFATSTATPVAAVMVHRKLWGGMPGSRDMLRRDFAVELERLREQSNVASGTGRRHETFTISTATLKGAVSAYEHAVESGAEIPFGRFLSRQTTADETRIVVESSNRTGTTELVDRALSTESRVDDDASTTFKIVSQNSDMGENQ